MCTRLVLSGGQRSSSRHVSGGRVGTVRRGCCAAVLFVSCDLCVCWCNTSLRLLVHLHTSGDTLAQTQRHTLCLASDANMALDLGGARPQLDADIGKGVLTCRPGQRCMREGAHPTRGALHNVPNVLRAYMLAARKLHSPVNAEGAVRHRMLVMLEM